MLNIAICDDDIYAAKQIEQFTYKLLLQNHETHKVHVFSSSKALFYEVQDGIAFDILLLDIEMPGLDGMELTAALKKYIPDALILFISSYEKYVYDTFSVHPFWFIPKSQFSKVFPTAFGSAIQQVQKIEIDFYIVKNQQGVEKIPVRNILYVWHAGKYAYIEKIDGSNTKFRKTLKDVFNDLSSYNFIWLDRSYFCHLTHVQQIWNGEAVLSNGQHLVINKERLQQVKSALLKNIMDFY